MAREEFEQLIKNRPVIIQMTDGRQYYIAPGQNVLIGDFNAGFLIDDNGIKRNAIVGYKNVASITRPASPIQ